MWSSASVVYFLFVVVNSWWPVQFFFLPDSQLSWIYSPFVSSFGFFPPKNKIPTQVFIILSFVGLFFNLEVWSRCRLTEIFCCESGTFVYSPNWLDRFGQNLNDKSFKQLTFVHVSSPRRLILTAGCLVRGQSRFRSGLLSTQLGSNW